MVFWETTSLLIILLSMSAFFFMAKYFSGIIDRILLYHKEENFSVRVINIGNAYLMIGFYFAILVYLALNLKFMGNFLSSISTLNKITVSIGAAIILPLTMRLISLMDIYHPKKIKKLSVARRRKYMLDYRERIGSFFFSFFLSFILLFLVIFVCMIFIDKTDILFELGEITTSGIKTLCPLLFLPWLMGLIGEIILILVGVPSDLRE